MFGFLGSTTIGTPEDPVPRRNLVALRDLVGADEAEYFELRRSDRVVLGLSTSDDMESVPGSDEALAAFGHQNPLGWRQWRPADGALRMSALVRRRDFERLGFHDAYLRPNGLRDVLKVWLWSSDYSAACVQLWRRDTDFTRREQDLLAALHHHLIDLRDESRAGASSAMGGASLTAREAEILSWAARGDSDQAIGARLGISAATVGKHLEHAYAALGVHSRAEALGWLMRNETQGPEAG